jgi:tryptophan synthase alpha chain
VTIEAHLRSLRAGGRKILAPYVMCGFPSPDAFPDLVRGIIDAGADMFEVGIPFSDPLMDGPVIQRASDVALGHEVRPGVALRTIETLEIGIPFVYMTYYNPILAMGEDAFAARARGSGAGGVIVPDLPVDEASSWTRAARAHELDPVFLAAPTTPRERLDAIVREGAGFIYCVSLLGVTGMRSSLSVRAKGVVDAVREATDRPALVGIGVSTAEQAAEACSFADGVIVGSAIVSAAEERGVDAAVALVKEMREAIDDV